jgi:hypothetical protein
MEKKKPFGTRLETFFAGNGFYVVLFLCVAVIGISAWSLLSGGLEKSAERAEVRAADEFAGTVAVGKTEVITLTEAPAPAAEVSTGMPEWEKVVQPTPAFWSRMWVRAPARGS